MTVHPLSHSRPLHELHERWEAGALAGRQPVSLALALVVSFGIHVGALLAPGASLPSIPPRFNSSSAMTIVLEVRLVPAPAANRSASAAISAPAHAMASMAFHGTATKVRRLDMHLAPRMPSPRTEPATRQPVALNEMRTNSSDAFNEPMISEPLVAADGSTADNGLVGARHGVATARPLTGAADSTPVAYLNNPKPIYPESARRGEQQGLVVLRVLVLADGSPTEISICKSSGFRTLDGAAVAGVKRWSFIPAKKNQQNIESWIDIPVQFRLNEDGW